MQVPPGLTDAPEEMEKLIVTPGVNPVPLTVTEIALGPWVGNTEIDGLVTVNEPLATYPSESVAVTEVPLVPEGTKKAQLNVPEPLTNIDPVEHEEMVTVSKTKDFRFVFAVKSVPDTVTEEPRGP